MSRWVMQISILITLTTESAYSLMIHRLGSDLDKEARINMTTCLSGGGSDESWVQGWQLLLKNSGGGDVVILQSDKSTHGYADWLMLDPDQNQFPRVNSVTTISIDQLSDSSNPEVLKYLKEAEFIFISGGDQSAYIQYMANTPLENILNSHLKNKTALFAGTSAGMAVLAGIDYRARYSSPSDPDSLVTSEDVLKDPTGQFVDLSDDFLVPQFMNHIITETHFGERDRFGRIVGFMANALFRKFSNYSQIKAIAADAGTAFCYNERGQGQVFGEGSVYFLNAVNPPEVLQSEQPLTWKGSEENALQVQILDQSSSFFDLITWKSKGFATNENWWVEQGLLYRKTQ